MKVLITGGTGFFGYHMSSYLNAHGIAHILYDLHPLPKGERKKPLAEVVIGDVRDMKRLMSLQGITNVIHAAAALPLEERPEIMSTNVIGTKTVLRWSAMNHVRRFVYISSTAVYGVPKVHPIDETAPRIGVGPYGESKIQAENACFSAIKKGLHVTIIRPKTFVGTARLGVFEILFDWVHENRKIPIIGNGKNHYQLLEVTDLCDAVYRAIESNRSVHDDVYNCGAVSFGTIDEDLMAFFAAVGSHSKTMPIPSSLVKTPLRIAETLHMSPLYQWVYDTADKDSFVSTIKLQKALGWKPRYSNSEALTRSYQWYSKHYSEIKARGTGTTHTVGWKQGVLGIVKRFM